MDATLGKWLPARARMVVCLGVLVLCAGLSPDLFRQVVFVGLLAWTAWRRPEVILALFLTAAGFKSNSLANSSFPADPTIVLAVMLLIGIASSQRHGGVRLPHAVILLFPIMLATGIGCWGTGSEYGTEKALRFGTLTLLAIVGCLSLLRRPKQFTVFLLTLSLVATAITALAAIGQQTDSTARLRLDGTSPITLARMSVMTLTSCWLSMRLVGGRVMAVLFIPAMLVAVYVAVATGSRGPILSLVVGFALLEFMARRYHAQSHIQFPLALVVIGAVILLVISGVIPAEPISRLQQAFTLDGDRSIAQRFALYKSSFTLLQQNPFGIGIGGFSEYAILNLRYPHNVFLETGVELGWVPMICLLSLCVWSIWTLIAVLRSVCDWTACLLAMITVMSGINAMFTGDFNDNRMFFALLLVPFLYRAALEDSRGREAEGIPGTVHAIHLASMSRGTP